MSMTQPESTNQITLKGFMVPPGHSLYIQAKDGRTIVKESGEYSGGTYKFSDIIQNKIPGWKLIKMTTEDTFRQPPTLADEVYSIANEIRQSGGDLYLVGGVVRDLELGSQSKDVDIEVYNLDAASLERILSKYGKVDKVGASFGIIKLTTATEDYDFSLPRRENREGQGHRGFVVEADPTMTPKEAASRRDFTFNSLSLSLEGKLLDFYEGAKDLKEKRLRHISDKFAEDPLRVLRGFQFAARFGLTIDKSTAALCKELKKEYQTLAKERIWGEWEKWATKGTKPSAGLEVLRETGWLEFYPEINILIGIPQEPAHHPEGDVYTHTKFVVDEAAEIADRENLDDRERAVLIFAALCHDFGKPSTTEHVDGKWRSYGHDKAGEAPTREFMARIGAPEWLTSLVVPLVVEHMSHINESTIRTVKRLAVRLHPANINQLARVIEADHSGRPPLPKELPPKAKKLLEIADGLQLEFNKPEPLVLGRHLLELAKDGELPEEFKRGGPIFKIILDILFESQLNGDFDDLDSGVEYLKQLLDPESLQKTQLFIAGLEKEQLDKLVGYANSKRLSESDVIKLPINQIEQIIS